jgi:diaminopimelate epimerase
MHGARNDYIYVDCLDGLPVAADQVPVLAAAVSERHSGVGSDGLILILPPYLPGTAFGFRMFNSDGSEGEMCGNGMRCFARFVVENGLTPDHSFTVSTLAGPIRCDVTPGGEGEAWQVTCDLGSPKFAAADMPTTLAPGPDGMVRERPFQVGGRRLEVTAVSTGVPHVIAFVEDDPGQLPWRALGRAIETHESFPKRTNVEFVRVLDRGRALAKVWERGSGETLACGTGACAVVVAGVVTGRLDREAVVSLPGGDLKVTWRETDGHMLLTGPAALVCRGEFVFAS